MTAEKALEQIKDYVTKKRNDAYEDMAYADEHQFKMERAALAYKSDALSDVICEINVMLFKLKNKEI